MVDLIQGNIRMGLLIINIPLNSILHTLEEAIHHSNNATRHHPTRPRGLKVPLPREEPRVDLRYRPLRQLQHNHQQPLPSIIR